MITLNAMVKAGVLVKALTSDSSNEHATLKLRLDLKASLVSVFMDIALDMAEREADTVSHDFVEFVCEVAFAGVKPSPDLDWLRRCVDFVVGRDA